MEQKPIEESNATKATTTLNRTLDTPTSTSFNPETQNPDGTEYFKEQDKVEIAEHALYFNFQEAAEDFDISLATVLKYVLTHRKDQFETKMKGPLRIRKGGRQNLHPDVDILLKEWLIAQQQTPFLVEIIEKAIKIDKGIPKSGPQSAVPISKSWVKRFCKRHGFSPPLQLSSGTQDGKNDTSDEIDSDSEDEIDSDSEDENKTPEDYRKEYDQLKDIMC